jgi:hypothetical protein
MRSEVPGAEAYIARSGPYKPSGAASVFPPCAQYQGSAGVVRPRPQSITRSSSLIVGTYRASDFDDVGIDADPPPSRLALYR